jgi:hypothetical protein
MKLPVIEQILIGTPQTFGEKEAVHPMDREWKSGIVKVEVEMEGLVNFSCFPNSI